MDAIVNAYDRYCTTRFPLPTEHEVAALEERLQVDLPDDYRDYLLCYNGGFFSDAKIVLPEPITVEWRDGLVTHTVDGLTNMRGLHPSLPFAELGKPMDLGFFEENGPFHLLPIGYTSVGCMVLLDLAPGYTGNILLKFPSAGAYTVAEGIVDFFGLIERGPQGRLPPTETKQNVR